MCQPTQACLKVSTTVFNRAYPQVTVCRMNINPRLLLLLNYPPLVINYYQSSREEKAILL